MRVAVAASAILVVLLSVPTRADNTPLSEFEAVFKVRASVASGELHMSLKAAGDGIWVFRTVTEPRGLVRILARGEIDETSRLRYVGKTIVPLDYILRDTISKNHDADYVFDWKNGIVSGTERGEAASAELQPGMLNRAALNVALMEDLKAGRIPDAYQLFDRGRVKNYEIESLGNETIEVPFGRFETLKLVRDAEDSRRSMILWCAPALDYLPIRIELHKGDKRVSIAELRAVKGLPSGQAVSVSLPAQ